MFPAHHASETLSLMAPGGASAIQQEDVPTGPVPRKTRKERRRAIRDNLASFLKLIPVDVLGVIASYAENTLFFENCNLSQVDNDRLTARKNAPQNPFRNTYDDWITVSLDHVFESGRTEWEILVEQHRTGEINGIVCGIYPADMMDTDLDLQCIGWSGPGWGVGNWGQRVVQNTQNGSYRRVRQGDRFGFVLEFDETTKAGRLAFFVNGAFQAVIFDYVGTDPIKAGVCLFYPETQVRVVTDEGFVKKKTHPLWKL